jgi:RHH-type rel operon transcriptional repressor/antitoxin RelB
MHQKQSEVQTMDIHLSKQAEMILVDLSKKTNAKEEQIIENALRSYLENIQDYYKAVEVSKRIEAGKEKTYSADEVFKQLGI